MVDNMTLIDIWQHISDLFMFLINFDFLFIVYIILGFLGLGFIAIIIEGITRWFYGHITQLKEKWNKT